MSILKIRNMKKVVLSLVLMIAAVTVSAQQIAVVSSNGTTTMCQTLGDAISKASSNSVIYLPAGGFQISDDVKITRKVTIIGVTHKANSDNAEGNTIISGNLYFNEGSSNSAVMGCYISGSVYIGYDNTEVNGILVKYCNLNGVHVYSNKCSKTKVNQNYIRNGSNFNGAEGTFTNNIMHSVYNMIGGVISYNILTDRYYSGGRNATLYVVYNATISNNVFLDASYIHYGYDCQISQNLAYNTAWGDDGINLGLETWDGVFKNNAGITPVSDYTFVGNYAEYNSKAGIYSGGTGFSDGCMPPVPYVSVKRIDEQTDAAGKLNVTLRVKSVSE